MLALACTFVIKIDCPGRRFTLFSDRAVVEKYTDRLCEAIYLDDLGPVGTIEDLREEYSLMADAGRAS